MFDVDKVRQDFPILERKINGRSLVYLDSAATAQRPRQVVQAVLEFTERHNANVNRGAHSLAEEATEMYAKAREKVASFVGGQPEELVFVRNTTEGLNLAATTLGSWLAKGDEVVITQMEHHSNLVPWQVICQQTGAKLRYLPVNKTTGQLGEVEPYLTKKVKIVSLVHGSNMLGTINAVREVAEMARRANPEVVVVVDAAQTVPHLQVKVADLGADMVAFSGHKMLGPMGIGAVWGKAKLLEKLPPFMYGGDMISEVSYRHTRFNKCPEKFEAGTPNVAGAIGLAAACEYLERLGMEAVRRHEVEITRYAMARLAQLPEVTIYGPREAEKRGGVVSFNWAGVHPHDVAEILNNQGVGIRSGHHCTQPLHDLLGLAASCRASFYIYTTKGEIDRLVEALAAVRKTFS